MGSQNHSHISAIFFHTKMISSSWMSKDTKGEVTMDNLIKAAQNYIEVTEHLNPCPGSLDALKKAIVEARCEQETDEWEEISTVAHREHADMADAIKQLQRRVENLEKQK